MTVSKTRETLIFYSLFPINSVVFLINLISSNDGLVAFHYSSYGTFCVHLKSSVISTVVLPTTEIIEPVSKTEAQPFDVFNQLVSRFEFRV